MGYSRQQFYEIAATTAPGARRVRRTSCSAASGLTPIGLCPKSRRSPSVKASSSLPTAGRVAQALAFLGAAVSAGGV